VSEPRPLAGRARWTTIALAAVILSDLVLIWSDIREVNLMDRVIEGEAVTDEELQSNDDRQALVAALAFAVFVVAVFFFIRWFHAAYSNLRLLGQAGLRYHTGWAIGGWFVPIAWWVRPKQIANDIWRGSDPDAPQLSRSAWPDIRVPLLLQVWWLGWIVSTVLGNHAFWLWLDTETPEEQRDATLLDAVALGLENVVAILAILVVRRLTARQEERARRVAAEPAATGTMPVA
jgi:hypothetical protein